MSRTSNRPATNPATPSSDPVSEAAPGVRTEGEVIADEQASIDAAVASAEASPPGATGNPAGPAADVPEEEDDSKVVHYLRESDGTVQSVNVGSVAHEILAGDGEWTKTTRAQAKKASA